MLTIILSCLCKQRRINWIIPHWIIHMRQPWLCSLPSIASNGGLRMDELWVAHLTVIWKQYLILIHLYPFLTLPLFLSLTHLHLPEYPSLLIASCSHHLLRRILLDRLPRFQINKKRKRTHWTSRRLSNPTKSTERNDRIRNVILLTLKFIFYSFLPTRTYKLCI